jgi:hypothetical protein
MGNDRVKVTGKFFIGAYLRDCNYFMAEAENQFLRQYVD